MADAFKVLGQANPVATTLTPLYTVGAATMATVSTVIVANRSSTPTTFRLSVAIAGAADTPAQYIAYDLEIGGNDAIPFTIGATLATTDVIRCYSTMATLSFNVFGVEVT